MGGVSVTRRALLSVTDKTGLENVAAVLSSFEFELLASGGTAVEGNTDFATPWLRHVLGFLGIREVETVAADQLMLDPGAEARAREAIARLEPPVSRIASAA